MNNEEKAKSNEAKKRWLAEAKNEELLHQLISMTIRNEYGCFEEDIRLTEEEILKRMEA